MAQLFSCNNINLYDWGNGKHVIPAEMISQYEIGDTIYVAGYNLSSVVETVNKTIDLNPEWKDKFVIKDGESSYSVKIKFLKQVIPDDKSPDEKYYHGRYELSKSSLLKIDFNLVKISKPDTPGELPDYKIIYKFDDGTEYINTNSFNNLEDFEKVLSEDIFAIAKIRITKFMDTLKKNYEGRLDYVDIFKDMKVSVEVLNILGLKYYGN